MARGWRTVGLASALAFGALAVVVLRGGVLGTERAVYAWATGQLTPGAVTLFGWLNYLGDVRFLLPAALVVALGAPATFRRHWWLWLGALASAPLLEGLAKELIGRTRPEQPSAGFPSGHVAAAAAFVVLLAYLGGKVWSSAGARVALWSGAGLVVVAVASARVALRAHWPLDTVGGAVLGVMCASAAAWWAERGLTAGRDGEVDVGRR
jgi:membrane-associated phospholipid phosphatase